MNYQTEYEKWLNAPVDEHTKAELLSIARDEEAKEFRFMKVLEFGTGGLRGMMMAGTNAMNVYTVAQATQGFANYINSASPENRSVVIAHDSRNNSELFSEIAARVFAANGIKTYFFDALRPTPVLSFSVRELGCAAGVMVTASHNPKEYNGYKAYWSDGAQLSLEQADEVAKYIHATDIFTGVKMADFDDAVKSGLIEIVGPVLDDKFIANVTAQLVDKNIIKNMADELKIVYTPLHGCGYRLVPEVLRLCGVKHLYTVAEQMVLDGNFPTVKSPNPENVEALELGEALARKVDCDLVIATDPDADRVGIKVKKNDGEFIPVTGNQVGALLLDYILTAYENTGTMPKDPYTIKTIVTTEIIRKISEEHNIGMFNVLTGFKFIGEVIKNHDDVGCGNFVFGFEESYGYLKGTYSRDKDSVVSVMLITEMAAYYKSKGMTLYDAIGAMYKRYGNYGERTFNIYKEGVDGAEKISALMQSIRTNPPMEIGGKKVNIFKDYLNKTVLNTATGKISETDLPVSNVLFFEMAGDIANNVVVIRPSGTEPKVKIYLLCNGATEEECNKVLDSFEKFVAGWKNF